MNLLKRLVVMFKSIYFVLSVIIKDMFAGFTGDSYHSIKYNMLVLISTFNTSARLKYHMVSTDRIFSFSWV